MAESFAGGLAQGLQAGANVGLRKDELEFEKARARNQDQRASQELATRQTEAGQRQAEQGLGMVAQQKQNLAHQAYADPNYAANAAQYRQQKYALEDKERELQRHIGGADLARFADNAERINDDVTSGRRDAANLSEKEFYDLVGYRTLRPASDFVDTASALGPVGHGLKRVHEGLEKLSQDGGVELLAGFNDLYGHELKGLIGEQAADHSTIIDARFAAPVPHPDDPSHAMLTAEITSRDPNGRIGVGHIPILGDHGRMTAHPEDAPDAVVKQYHVGDLLNHIGATEAVYQAINGHPELRSKAISGYLNGHADDAQDKIDLIHQLGHDPREWTPKRELISGVPEAASAKTAAPDQSGKKDYSHLWGARRG